MAFIETASIELSNEFEVQYIAHQADPSIGVPAHVEIVSVKLCGMNIPLCRELKQLLASELREDAFA